MMRLSQVQNALGAVLAGEDGFFASVSSDTRTLLPGALFVALRGKRHDGHDFLIQAREKGAAAALAHKACPGLPCLVVPDTALALLRLAALWRQEIKPISVIAVTGTNGKTTVKEMLGAIFSQSGRPIMSPGNRNNEVGAPLSLLTATPSHTQVVLELGINAKGEMARLGDCVRPDLAMITNAQKGHLEGFGDTRGVAEEKGVLLSFLQEGGTAVLNRDDPHFPLWQEMARGKRILTFGSHREATVRGDLQDGELVLRAQGEFSGLGEESFPFSLLGRHNLQNALAAAAAALALGVEKEDIAKGLQGFGGVPGRLTLRVLPGGAQVLDDTYNANPGSLEAGLAVLKHLGEKRKILVLGDMGELGSFSQRAHEEAGEMARASGTEKLLALGKWTRYACKSFGEGAAHFENAQDLAHALLSLADGKTAVLVKGSRAMRMEEVVDALFGNAASCS